MVTCAAAAAAAGVGAGAGTRQGATPSHLVPDFLPSSYLHWCQAKKLRLPIPTASTPPAT